MCTAAQCTISARFVAPTPATWLYLLGRNKHQKIPQFCCIRCSPAPGSRKLCLALLHTVAHCCTTVVTCTHREIE